MKLNILILAVLFSSLSFAQQDKIHSAPSNPAVYEGGLIARQDYFRTHLKFPIESEKKGVNGVVRLYAIIDVSGKVSDVEITSGINPECDAEAKRVVLSMPNWKPAKHKNELVKSKVLINVHFTPDIDKIDNPELIKPSSPKPLSHQEVRDLLKNKKKEVESKIKKTKKERRGK